MKKGKSNNRYPFHLLSFFLLAISLSNLIGNFIGISSHYTFYHYGLTMVLIVSRYLEDLIFNYVTRTLVLGLVTMATSGVYFLLYHYAKKGRLLPLLLGVLLFAFDFLLISSPFVYEPANFLQIMRFNHLIIFSLLLILTTLVVAHKETRSNYDYA